MNLCFHEPVARPIAAPRPLPPKRGDLRKIFWTNLIGALLLSAGAVFLVAAPVDAQNQDPPRCSEYCWWEWHEECWITPDAGNCFGNRDEICEERCHHE